jgi:DNA-binding NtrC family response regulator
MAEEIKILAVDDEEPFRRLLKKELTRKGYFAETASDGAAAVKMIKEGDYDVVLLDIVMPGINGIEVMEMVKTFPKKPEIIVLTGQATVDTAVQAMKHGAYDYLSKPYKTDELMLLINRAYDYAGLKQENRLLQQELSRTKVISYLVGASKEFGSLLSLIRKAAPSDASILLQGESGTGKEMVAKTIWKSSKRKNGQFVALNCASLSEALLESELFGHEKGAFTNAFQLKNGLVEVADNGTLFLDEIGDMPVSLQAKLLRFLDSGEFRRVGGNRNLKVDVRVIAATNMDIVQLVREGRFREDLYYRLNVVTITVPPLRDRKEDIPVLADHFLRRYAKRSDKHISGISPRALEMLMAYNWPGNVRELENVIERAVILSEGDMLTPSGLSLTSPHSAPSNGHARKLEDIERQHIARILKETGGSQKKASELLGIDRKTLYLKLKRYSLSDGE